MGHATHLVTLVKSFTSLGHQFNPYEIGRDSQAPATGRPCALSVKPSLQRPRSFYSKDPSRARAHPTRPCPSLHSQAPAGTLTLDWLLRVLEREWGGELGARASGDSGKFQRHQGSSLHHSYLTKPLPTLFPGCNRKLLGEGTRDSGGHRARETTVGWAVVRKGVLG